MLQLKENILIEYVLNYNYSWGLNGEPNKFDLRSVLTHEFGHIWRLADLRNSGARRETMYFTTRPGAINGRTIHCGDIEGVEEIYGTRP